MSSHDSFLLLRIRVLADSDPSALARVVERFTNLNIVPRRLLAEFVARDTLHVEVDVLGLRTDQVALIAAKIRETPSVIEAHWYQI